MENISNLIKDQKLEDIAFNLFGFKSKMAKRIVQEKVLLDNPDQYLAFLIYVFSRQLSFNKDYIFKACCGYFREDGVLVDINLDLIEVLKEKYGEKRVIQLFFQEDNLNLWADIQDMLLFLKTKTSLDNILFKKEKPQTLEDFHNKLDGICQKYSQEDFNLHQRKEVLKLDGISFLKDYSISTPKTHHEMVELGGELNFCLGNGVYSHKVLNKESSLVIVKRDNNPLYAIEFGKYKITQAKGVANSDVPQEILDMIEKVLIKSPKMPKGYINVDKHKWIQGFKYEHKDLFIVIKNVKNYNNFNVYQYKNISEELFKDFQKCTHKGKFLNKYIKPNCVCERIMVEAEL